MYEWHCRCTIAPEKCPKCGSQYTIPDGEDLDLCNLETIGKLVNKKVIKETFSAPKKEYKVT